jgi:hypothetical protein
MQRLQVPGQVIEDQLTPASTSRTSRACSQPLNSARSLREAARVCAEALFQAQGFHETVDQKVVDSGHTELRRQAKAS